MTSMLSPVAGVLFDMDGVLVDSAGPHEESWRRLAARHEIKVTPEQFRRMFGQTSRDIIRALWGERHLTDTELRRLDDEKELIYRELIEPKIPLMPGCRRLLERLRRAGLALGVATSGPPENLEVVLSFGLIANYFDAEVHGFDIGAGKPAPDCFLLAAARLQLPPTACVVIEDAPVGIAAGRAAGMPVVGLVGTHPARKLTDAGAALVVNTLDEITPAALLALLPEPQRSAG